MYQLESKLCRLCSRELAKAFQNVVSIRQIDGRSPFKANASIPSGSRVLENLINILPKALGVPVRLIADAREKGFVQGLAIIQTAILDEAAFLGYANLGLEPKVHRVLYLCCGPNFSTAARAEPNVKGRFEENAPGISFRPSAGHLARK